jgi:hypothetical protein
MFAAQRALWQEANSAAVAAATAGSPADVETLMHQNQDKLRMLKVGGWAHRVCAL